MMHQTWKKPNPYLVPGMQIRGKWNQNVYIIKRKLGEGAIGAVYLCETGRGRQAALKISDKGSSITTEVNVLKAMKQAQEKNLGPYLLDVDDWVKNQNERYSFYVMEYIQGESLPNFIKQKGSAWVGVFMLQLLDDLDKLHQSGWVFGDLKTENLLIAKSPARIRWIDVGGTTKVGRAIKEYTEFYDRGYWGLGSRRAEASYDLFSLVMVFLNIYYPKRFEKRKNTKQQLFRKIDAVRALQPYNDCFKKAVTGKYQSSAQMRREISAVIYKAQKSGEHTKGERIYAVESVGIFLVAIIYYLASVFLF
ncbi:MAG TPA: serine/threonine-protein kinase [Candidatus Avamphibacillus sp.]|nr:serine/threonine-protein kinase [Candidatus Avamphibacillus sp.]